MIFLARVSEQAKRFSNMIEFLQNAIENKRADDEFSVEEWNLLSVGFKNIIGVRRSAIRTINAIEQNPKYEKFADALSIYKKKIEGELQEKCAMVIDMVKGSCLKRCSNDESKAFFWKMIGDY